jgi:hypothetical protein
VRQYFEQNNTSVTQLQQRLTFSTSAKLSLSTLRSTGTTRPFGVATAMEMSV